MRQVHVEVENWGGLPVIGDIEEESGDETEKGFGVRKDANDSGAAFDFLTEPLGGVGGAQAGSVWFWKGEDGEAFGDVIFEPGGEFWSGFAILRDQDVELGLSLSERLGVEDFAKLRCEDGTECDLGNVVNGILLEVELAALPEDSWKAGSPGSAQAWMIIADYVSGAMEAPLLERAEEVTPVDLSLAESGGDADNGALARGIDADGQEHGAIDDGAIAADFFVTGIEDEIRVSDVVERTVTPEFELLIELSGGAADLGRGDLERAGEFGENRGDAAGGDALNVHLGNGEGEGAFSALAPLESRGVEVDVATDLRDFDGNFAETSLEGFGFEAVGVTLAGRSALVRICAESLGALNFHGMVKQKAERFGKGV